MKTILSSLDVCACKQEVNLEDLKVEDTDLLAIVLFSLFILDHYSYLTVNVLSDLWFPISNLGPFILKLLEKVISLFLNLKEMAEALKTMKMSFIWVEIIFPTLQMKQLKSRKLKLFTKSE
jgi:hypothetical protein